MILKQTHSDAAKEVWASCTKCGWANSQPVLTITDTALAGMTDEDIESVINKQRERAEAHHAERCKP